MASGAASRGVLGSLAFELKFWVRYLLPTRYVAVFYPTPLTLIDRMLDLTECGPRDTLFDLGCGDGRILIEAAKRGATAVGYELDKQLVAQARMAVKAGGLEHKIQVIHKDAHGADVSSASVIALYLSDHGNRQLLHSVRSTLQPGTKVVSNFFGVQGWEHALVKTITTESGPIHLYHAPAHKTEPT